jgi:GT2 family glycosyltransferase
MPPTSEDNPILVSVVIISYNGRQYLQDLLESVTDQDYPRGAYEVVVVDNASADGSAELIEQQFPSVKLIRLDRNYGPGVAVARAFPHLKGKYLAYLNQDVVVHRRWLAELMEVMTTHPRAAIVESNMILPQWPEYNGRRREGLIERAYVCDVTSFGVYDFRVVPVTPDTPPIPVLGMNGAGVLFHPGIKEALGYLVDPGFAAHAEDMDLGLRANAAGLEVLLAPRSVLYHDTQWHFRWNRRNLRRAWLVTQNTILAFYKVSYTSEFLRLLPRLLVGKQLKATQHCEDRPRKVLYFLAATPMALVGALGALWKMPSYRERRRETLRHRKMEAGWLLERLLSPEMRPDGSVWQGGQPGQEGE